MVLMVIGIGLSFTMRPDRVLDDVVAGAESAEPVRKFV
jgi:hypothetical protein